jgi:hypothetical protein
MTDDNTCPHCNADLQGKPIPQEYIDEGFYGDLTHYSRRIGVEIRGVYDGMLFWQCPDCGGRWHRWTDADMRKKAEPYVNGDK